MNLYGSLVSGPWYLFNFYMCTCVCAYAGVHVVDAHVHLCMCGIFFYHVYVRQINMCIICVHNLLSCFLQKLKLSWCANNLYSLYFMHDTWCKDWSFPESVQMNHIWFNNVVMYVSLWFSVPCSLLYILAVWGICIRKCMARTNRNTHVVFLLYWHTIWNPAAWSMNMFLHIRSCKALLYIFFQGLMGPGKFRIVVILI
jgi:hypothetical protein